MQVCLRIIFSIYNVILVNILMMLNRSSLYDIIHFVIINSTNAFFSISVESYDVCNNNNTYLRVLHNGMHHCKATKLLHYTYCIYLFPFCYWYLYIVLKGKRWTHKILLNTQLVYVCWYAAHSRCIKFRIVIRVLPFKSVRWQF